MKILICSILEKTLYLSYNSGGLEQLMKETFSVLQLSHCSEAIILLIHPVAENGTLNKAINF